jgi:hypothetical protein
LVNTLIPITDEMSDRRKQNRERRREMIRVRWIGEPATAWTALNAVNGYELWDRPVRGGDTPDVRRAARQATAVLRGRQRLTDTAHALLIGART